MGTRTWRQRVAIEATLLPKYRRWQVHYSKTSSNRGYTGRARGASVEEEIKKTGVAGLLLFTLADNVSFFESEPDRARIEACTRMALLHDDIVRMPMGYETLVGDLGHGLSGGQKQRLLLARALYTQPAILAMDEATSHLDLTAERAITQVLAQLPITRVLIAHRPDTIAGAQRVVVLREGALTEQARAETAGP